MDIEERSSSGNNELDALATNIEEYEDKHFPMDLPDPIVAINFRMEQSGLNQSDFIPTIGSGSMVSEVLKGKRGLTLNMISALHKHLHIPIES